MFAVIVAVGGLAVTAFHFLMWVLISNGMEQCGIMGVPQFLFRILLAFWPIVLVFSWAGVQSAGRSAAAIIPGSVFAVSAAVGLFELFSVSWLFANQPSADQYAGSTFCTVARTLLFE